MTPRSLLRLEGALIFVAALIGYDTVGPSWWFFVVLFLAPDLFMCGYLAGPRIGAHLYNVGHTYAVPLAVGALSIILSDPFVGAIALIWAAHIGIDRAIGYGLKHDTGFHDTHLSTERSPSPNGIRDEGRGLLSSQSMARLPVRADTTRS